MQSTERPRVLQTRVPTRDALVVAGSDDVEALKGLLALARDAIEKQPGLVSTVAVRLDGDEWKP